MDQPGQLEGCLSRLGLPVVLKCQVYAKGRGRAGAVATAQNGSEAAAFVRLWLGSRLGAERVTTLLVERKLTVRSEAYLAFRMNRSSGRPEVLVSPAGGMDVETSAVGPGRLTRIGFSLRSGLSGEAAERAARALGFPAESALEARSAVLACASLFLESDCLLLEINPFALTAGGGLAALDARMEIDDDALFRHPEIDRSSRRTNADGGESASASIPEGTADPDGDIGILVNGAGLAMAALDAIRLHGGKAASFLDIGGAADENAVAAAAMRAVRGGRTSVLLVQVFGGIVRCDTVAAGILAAAGDSGFAFPVIVRFTGTAKERGISMLRDSGRGFVFVETFDEAVRRAVEAAGAVKRAGGWTGRA
jgi:succinyl-CoA synthetase beta subunit